jgi:hypothetical protein
VSSNSDTAAEAADLNRSLDETADDTGSRRRRWPLVAAIVGIGAAGVALAKRRKGAAEPDGE